MRKKLALFIILIVCGACSGSKQKLEISGSTSVAPVMEKLITAYEKDHNEQINLTADGSSAGISAAKAGVSDIGMSSRALKSQELDNELNIQVIAIDAIAVIINKDNTVDNLTVEDLHDIFTGKKTNWHDFGGRDRPIVIISRESGSGTRAAFEEVIEAQDANGVSLVDSNNPVIVNSTGGVVENVKQKDGAIGYISLGSVDKDVKVTSLNGIVATEANVKAKLYPISRDFYLVSKKNNDKVSGFINYILSADGQQIIENEGFIKVR